MKAKFFIQFAILLLTFPTFSQSQTPFKISGELRSRVEGRENADFNTQRLDGTVFVLNRARIGISREFERGIDVFVQLQDSRLWGEEGASLAALDALDLHQAWLEIEDIAGLPFDLRLGRQELAFGSERLIGRYDWHNVGRAFDAVQLTVGQKRQNLRLWLAQVRDFNAPTIRRNQEFSGAYFSTQKIIPGTIESYLLYFFDKRNFSALTPHDHSHGASEGPQETEPGSSHLNVWTVGSRFQTKLFKQLEFEVESVYQFGNRGPQDIRAYGFALESAYALSAKAKPALLFGYTFGSGDGNHDDAKIETFTNLFPDAHAFLGNMDYVSWSNLSAFYFGGTLQPAKDFKLGAKLYFFALADGNDAFYRAEGSRVGSPAEIFRTAVPGAGTDVGKEIDLFAKFLYRDRINVALGFSRFFVGEFLENTGGLRADDSYFGYFAVAVGF